MSKIVVGLREAVEHAAIDKVVHTKMREISKTIEDDGATRCEIEVRVWYGAKRRRLKLFSGVC